MIRRPPRSTQSRSSAASDVYKRQLGYGGGALAAGEESDGQPGRRGGAGGQSADAGERSRLPYAERAGELPHAEGAVIDLLQAGVQRECAGGLLGIQLALAELLGEPKLGAAGLVFAGCGLHEAASGYGKWDCVFRRHGPDDTAE